MTDVTRILSAIEQGDPSAAEQLLPLVYEKLRMLAAAKLANEKASPDAAHECAELDRHYRQSTRLGPQRIDPDRTGWHSHEIIGHAFTDIPTDLV